MTRQDLDRLLALPNRVRSSLEVLDDRELEVISLMAQGNAGSQISQEMGLDKPELAQLKERIQKKLGLKNEVELVQFAARQRTCA